MGIRVLWADDNRRSILRLDFEEQWSFGELLDLLEGLDALLDAAEVPVSLVLHHGSDHKMIGLSEATDVSIRLTPVLAHKQCRCVVVVGVQGRLKALYEVAVTREVVLYFADTLDEGYDLIRMA